MADSKNKPIHVQWWDKSSEVPLYKAIWDNVEFLQSRDGARQQRMLQAAQRYSNTPFGALAGDAYGSVNPAENDDPIRINITRATIDTAQTEVCSDDVRAAFLAQKGSFSLHQKAQKLEQFVWGIFRANEIDEKAPDVFRDCEIFGTGFLKVNSVIYKKDEDDEDSYAKIIIDRVPPWRPLVDAIEAQYGEPRSMYDPMPIDRHVLLSRFPEKREMIMDAKRISSDVKTGIAKIGCDTLADQLMTIEAYHLPSGPEAKDGCHAIIIETGILFGDDEEERRWNRARFPYARLCYARPIVGYYGEALADENRGVQLELNDVALRIQQANYHQTSPVWWLEEGSHVTEGHFNNALRGRTQKYVGTMPQLIAPNPVHPQIYAYQESLIDLGFQLTGISRLSAQSQKPAGLNAGIALQEYIDIGSRRMVLHGKAYGKMHAKLGKIVIDECRALEEAGIAVEVNARVKRGRKVYLDLVKFADVAMGEDEFDIDVQDASAFPRSPTGRKREIENLYQSGLISKETALEALKLDSEMAVSRELSPTHVVEAVLDKILETGKYTPPEPFFDLQGTLARSLLVYLDAIVDDVPQERLDLLIKFIEATQALIEKAAADAAAKAAPPAPAPDAAMAEMAGAEPMAAPEEMMAPEMGVPGAPMGMA